MSSLSEQLLKAGLVTEEQVKKAAEKPKKKKHSNKNFSKNQKAPNRKTNNKPKAEPSDLAQFYGERKKLENKEKQEETRKKKEAARIKKETNQKINKLISDNLLNDDAAEIRFNFVVGTSIKYLFVTEKQQQDLTDGKLAFTFLGGKRCLIPIKTANDIIALNPNKVVIIPN